MQPSGLQARRYAPSITQWYEKPRAISYVSITRQGRFLFWLKVLLLFFESLFKPPDTQHRTANSSFPTACFPVPWVPQLSHSVTEAGATTHQTRAWEARTASIAAREGNTALWCQEHKTNEHKELTPLRRPSRLWSPSLAQRRRVSMWWKCLLAQYDLCKQCQKFLYKILQWQWLRHTWISVLSVLFTEKSG